MAYSPAAHNTATAGRAGFVRLGSGVSGQADGTLITTSVPNGVITSGSYADPSWITSLSGSKLSGTVVATNGVVTTSSYADPSWITSLSANKIGSGSPTFTGLTVTQATSLNTTTINNGKLTIGSYDQLIETSNNEFSLASGASYTGTADNWTQNQPYLWSSRITQGQITQVAGSLIRLQYTNTNVSSVTWQDALRIDTSGNTIIPTKTAASSTVTGALQVAGGGSFGGSVYVYGSISAGNTVSANSLFLSGNATSVYDTGGGAAIFLPVHYWRERFGTTQTITAGVPYNFLGTGSVANLNSLTNSIYEFDYWIWADNAASNNSLVLKSVTAGHTPVAVNGAITFYNGSNWYTDGFSSTSSTSTVLSNAVSILAGQTNFIRISITMEIGNPTGTLTHYIQATPTNTNNFRIARGSRYTSTWQALSYGYGTFT